MGGSEREGHRVTQRRGDGYDHRPRRGRGPEPDRGGGRDGGGSRAGRFDGGQAGPQASLGPAKGGDERGLGPGRGVGVAEGVPHRVELLGEVAQGLVLRFEPGRGSVQWSGEVEAVADPPGVAGFADRLSCGRLARSSATPGRRVAAGGGRRGPRGLSYSSGVDPEAGAADIDRGGVVSAGAEHEQGGRHGRVLRDELKLSCAATRSQPSAFPARPSKVVQVGIQQAPLYRRSGRSEHRNMQWSAESAKFLFVRSGESPEVFLPRLFGIS